LIFSVEYGVVILPSATIACSNGTKVSFKPNSPVLTVTQLGCPV